MAELHASRREETILAGRFAPEAEFLNRFQSGVSMLAIVQADETEDEVLGILGVERAIAAQAAGSVFYARYRDSVLFWDGLQKFFDEAFRIFPFRRLYVEVPSYLPVLAQSLPSTARLDLRLRTYKFHNGDYHDLELWSVWRGDR